jgi:sulfonate dioxygenase
VPPTGGDTAWASQAAAYQKLSQPIKALLEGLRAEHSGFPQAEHARRDGHFVRREPIKSEHPIVRVHPVCEQGRDVVFANRLLTKLQATGQKVLYVNPGFTKRIIGLREEESAALLKLLFKVRFSLGACPLR